MKEIIIDSKETVFSSFIRTALYYETDQMGIIHHSNYIRWFEEARLHYMKELGLPYDELERMGIIIPVLSVDCRYRQPVRYDETVRIHMSITKFNGVKMRAVYEVRDEKTNELRAEGAARELINRIQNIRKESGFEVTDKIRVQIELKPQVEGAIADFADYIASQTLAVEVTGAAEPQGAFVVDTDVNDEPLRIAVTRVQGA